MKNLFSYFRMFSALILGAAALASCKKETPAEIQGGPSQVTDLQGLYTRENLTSDDSFIRIALQLNDNKSLVLYVDSTDDDEDNGYTKNGKWEYNPMNGCGTVTLNGNDVLDFIADKEGYIILYDQYSKHDEFKEGLWLTKQDYDFADFNSRSELFECEYEDSFGCTGYVPERIVDVGDLIYQGGDDDSWNLTKAGDDNLSVSGLASWAFKSLATGAASAVGGSVANFIMSQLGMGLGAKMNKISDQLKDVQRTLDATLIEVNKVFTGVAETNINNHINDRNDLFSIVDVQMANLPSKLVTPEDTLQLLDVLFLFERQKNGAELVRKFIGNVMNKTFDRKNLYQAYDSYIYCNYVWEEQGYAARENFRAMDMVTIVRGSMLAMLYFDLMGQSANMKTQAQMLQQYLEFYQENRVRYNMFDAVCQLKDCKMSISLDMFRREPNGKHRPKSGTGYIPCNLRYGSEYTGEYQTGPTAFEHAYGYTSMSSQRFSKEGLRMDEIRRLIDAHKSPNGREMSLYDILFNVAKCRCPYSKSELEGRTLCIMRAFVDTVSTYPNLCAFASPKEVRFGGYTQKNNEFTQFQVGTPELAPPGGEWWSETAFLHASYARIHTKTFKGWKTYNDQVLWCYPRVAHHRPLTKKKK